MQKSSFLENKYGLSSKLKKTTKDEKFKSEKKLFSGDGSWVR
jgi:hypothetical protein